MWSPTHVQVVVQRAENLLIKGKHGTNNSFVVIQLGKETYRTSIKEKSGESVFWNEECDLKIPKAGNTAVLELIAYHRNTLGLDQFLGSVRVPLVSFEKFQKTTQWYRLQGKPGKEKGKDKLRGELEVQITFIAKQQSQSLTSLQSTKKSFAKLTGSLFSLKQGNKSLSSGKISSKIGKNVFKRKKKDSENLENIEETYNNHNHTRQIKKSNNLDPGVVSDEEDSGSLRSSESFGNTESSRNHTPSPQPHRNFSKTPEISISQWEDNNLDRLSVLGASNNSIRPTENSKLENLRGRLTDRRLSISCVDFSCLATPKPEKKFSSTLQLEKSGGESHNKLLKLAKKLKFDRKKSEEISAGSEELTTVPKSEFKNKNKDELINMVVDLQKRVNCISVRVKDLEDYLDRILVKVMENVPKLLEKT